MTTTASTAIGTLSAVARNGVASIGALASGATDAAAAEKEKLEKTAKAFEAVFVRQLIGSMRKAGFDDDLTGSSAVDQFQELSDARTADTMADQGAIGIAEMLMSRLAPKAAASTGAAATGAASSGATTAGQVE